MRTSLTIPRSGSSDPCSNYEDLLQRGLKYCQQLGGDLWTDFNLHDPGVTILQQLCYAITDLSYRTDFHVRDLLEPGPDVRKPEQPLFTGDKILTSNPVTTADYQKLLYDRIKGVKNIWLIPLEKHPLGITGLYEVLVETWEDVSEKDKLAVQENVKQHIRASRNLAEDVEKVTILKPQKIRVEGVIVIGPGTNPVSVLAQVLFNIQNSLIPYPKAQVVDELFQTMQPDEIWNGPRLTIGALDAESLKPIKHSVDLQEIVKIILQTPGVKLIKDLEVSSPDVRSEKQRIQIQPGYVPRLDPSLMALQNTYTISVEWEGGVKCDVDSKAVWAKIQEFEGDIRNREAYATRTAQATEYVRGPNGNYKDIENYFSIQPQFPVVYGLSKYGVPDSSLDRLVPVSGQERHARAQQLKAYLLFFEQLLANYLSQLAHVGELFSLDESLPGSYFYQQLAHEPAHPSDPQRIVDVLIQQSDTPRKSVRYFFVQMVNQNGNVGLISAHLSTRAQAEELRDRMIESGRSIRNYRIRQVNGSEYRLVLYSATGDLLASGPEQFANAGAAQSSAGRWLAGVIGAKDLHSLVNVHLMEELMLQVRDEKFRTVLTSTPMESQEERDKRILEMIECGADALNYHPAPVPHGGYRVHLHNSQGAIIAEGEEVFKSPFEADEGREKLANLMARIAKNRLPKDLHIQRFPNVEPIGQSRLQAYKDGLHAMERQHDNDYLGRRNKILNHLLARLGENFDDDILQQLDVRPYGGKDDFFRELIRWKIEFLRGYIEPEKENDSSVGNGLRQKQEIGLGSGKGQAFDYTRPNTVSGLEWRLALLLGIHGHMDDEQYNHLDTGERGFDAPVFHYIEKQVSRPEWEETQHEENDHNEHGKQQKRRVPRYAIRSKWRESEPDLHDLHHNFVFSSEDSAILRHLLSLGTNRENYYLRRMPDGCQVLFRSPTSNYDLEVHRAIGENEAEAAISDLIRYFRQLKDNTTQSYAGERIWVVEHVLLRPRAQIEDRPIQIFHESGIHLSSHPLPKLHREEHWELIRRHGRHHENYRIETDARGEFIVILYHEHHPIACTHAVRDHRQAAAAIPKLAELIRSIAGYKNEEVLENHVSERARDAFYSQRISVLLPNWPLRFQSNEFKLYAEQMVQENSPAHLTTNVFWLSVYEAKEFDSMYRRWQHLSVAVHGESQEKNLQDLDEAADKLKTFIQRLQKEQDLWAAATAEMS